MALSSIVIASGNAHKFREFEELFEKYWSPTPPRLVRLSDAFHEPLPKETGKTYLENAKLKAEFVFRKLQQPVLADDSGLEVEGLQGGPGLFSARYAGVHASDDMNRAKLLADCQNLKDSGRVCRFVCALVLILQTGIVITAQGTVDGRLLFQEVGQGGFGYDPVFYFEPRAKTFSEMSAPEKNEVSHRANALKELRKAWLKS